MSTILIGSDVEYWKADSTPLDVYELALKEIGSKNQPSVGPYGPYHSDQVWAERATRPCATLSELLDDLTQGQIWLESMMGMPLQGVSYIDQAFDEFEFPFLFKQAREFGCSPDMVNGQYRRVPRGIKERSLREAGAHIHFNLPRAYTETVYHTRGQWQTHGNMMQRFVRQVQEALGPYHKWDHELPPWYRKPGTYRLKPYGVEYRSIGAGILSDPDQMIGVYSAAFDLLADVWERTYIMIGYNNLSHWDWEHYFEGGYCFHRTGDTIRCYAMGALETEDQDYDWDEDGNRYPPPQEVMVGDFDRCGLHIAGGSQRSVDDPEVRLYLHEAKTSVSLHDLFFSSQWVVHRFQLGYVPLNGTTLAYVGMEPVASRMMKALSPNYLYTHGIVDVDMVSERTTIPMSREIERGLISGRNLRHDQWPDLWSGVCEVLSYGKCHPFRRGGVSTRELIRAMLSGEDDRMVLCPDFTTAVVRHRSRHDKAYVITNGHIVGTLALEFGSLMLYVRATKYGDRQARTLAKKALEDRAIRLYADKIVWEV